MAAFDEFHAALAGAIALADFVNGDNAWMLKTGGGFRFTTESLQVRFRGPMTEADDLERDCAIQTFLPGAIDYALTAASDFFQQFVIAKISQHFSQARSTALVGQRRCRVFNVASEQTEAGLQQTGAAKFLRRVSKDFRATLCTDFGGRRHVAGRTIHRPNKIGRAHV